MEAFGDRPAADITMAEVSKFLREYDRHRRVAAHGEQGPPDASAIFNSARREDTFGLPGNPVLATDKRREPRATALVFYEPAEIEALAAAGGRRPAPKANGQSEGAQQESPALPEPLRGACGGEKHRA
jgi:hypothetical protein